jgi:hypothetical protein
MSDQLNEVQGRAVQLVAQGLQALRNRWGHGVQPPEIYELSPILRSLVTHDNFTKAWRLLFPPSTHNQATVVAPDLLALVSREAWPRIAFAQTAGIAVPGMHLWMPVAVLGDRTTEPNTAQNRHDDASTPSAKQGGELPSETVEADGDTPDGAGAPDGHPVDDHFGFELIGGRMSGLIDQESVPLAPDSCYRRYGFHKFLDAPCVVRNGVPRSRKWLVTALANHRGIAHIEWDSKHEDHQYIAETGNWLSISGRSALLYEFVSIGQMITNSKSARQLCDRVQEIGLPPLG